METAKDRVMVFLAHLGVGQTKFEAKCGISRGYLNKSKGALGTDIVRRITTAYPELSPEWLATGEGAMLRGQVVQTSHGDGSYNVVGDVRLSAALSAVDKLAAALAAKDAALAKAQEQIDELIKILKDR